MFVLSIFLKILFDCFLKEALCFYIVPNHYKWRATPFLREIILALHQFLYQDLVVQCTIINVVKPLLFELNNRIIHILEWFVNSILN